MKSFLRYIVLLVSLPSLGSCSGLAENEKALIGEWKRKNLVHGDERNDPLKFDTILNPPFYKLTFNIENRFIEETIASTRKGNWSMDMESGGGPQECYFSFGL